MAFVKTSWVDGSLPSISAAQLNRMEQGIADAHAAVEATAPVESTLTTVGTYADPNGGAGGIGPTTPALTIPTGGRWVDMMAECEAHYSSNNNASFGFIITFSKDGAAFANNPPSVYGSSQEYADTGSQDPLFGVFMDWGDGVYRPLRYGFARTPNAPLTATYLMGSPTKLFLPAGSWQFKMMYGIRTGSVAGTAYFRTRRIRVSMMPA